ncbi:MAG: hypothetical protein ABJO28_17175 [Maribacter dokdonensis]|uniref:hypothetical protein n=1 Tax=Maribacter dokdonensis TaxID=320912 RepID=UPI00326533A4
MIKQFLKYTGEFLRNYPQIRLTSAEEISVRDSVIQSLGLNNIGQVRDRYEGQAFWDKTLKNYGGLLICQKHLKLEILKIQEIDIKDFKPVLKVNDISYEILVFDFGTLPLIEPKEIKNPIIFIIQKDKSTFSICGFADEDTVSNNLIDAVEETVNTKNLKNFIGFKKLKPINDIIKK